jgi:hypothetical protein
MYPFERTIFIGLITKTKEDIAKWHQNINKI